MTTAETPMWDDHTRVAQALQEAAHAAGILPSNIQISLELPDDPALRAVPRVIPEGTESRTGAELAAANYTPAQKRALIGNRIPADMLGKFWPTYALPSMTFENLMMTVGQYVTIIETESTERTCKCEWIIHPDDVQKASGRRMRRGEPSLICAVHTKEGFLLGFVHYLVTGKIDGDA